MTNFWTLVLNFYPNGSWRQMLLYFGFVLQLTRFWNSRTWSSSWNSRNCVWTRLSFKLKSSLAAFPLPLLNCSVRPQAAINTVRIESCRSSHIVSASSNQEIFQIQKFRTKSIYSSYISTSVLYIIIGSKFLSLNCSHFSSNFLHHCYLAGRMGSSIFMNTCGNRISSIHWNSKEWLKTFHEKFHEY